MSKRTLDAYLKPAGSSATDASSSKKLKETVPSPEDIKDAEISKSADTHPSYPFSISALHSHISTALKTTAPARAPKEINNQPHLDLLYYEPFIPRPTADEYFKFLRRELPFYRVKYTIKRGPTETLINTPRYTTVFGVDGTSYFSLPPNGKHEGGKILLDSKTHQRIPKTKYKCTPRPIPLCLDALRQHVETALNDGTSYNFVLVNYYASGDDSISYHSDDERFLGPLPNIASLTLGARRDFLLKHKPVTGSITTATTTGTTSKDKPLKLPLGSGDMVIMRGETQSNWLHSIPKRKGGESGSGRINITLRNAVVPGGTENYYRYNVGEGGLYRWDESKKEMVLAG
jgi:alkylated DNA repair dioxygenase AlkB